MKIIQKEITLKPRERGYWLVTDEISDSLPALRDFNTGFAHIFIKHTSAALTINEDADPAVRDDFSTFFNKLVPDSSTIFKHTAEGPDDMTSHIKSSLMGSSISLPVKNGKFNIGAWQGIYLCEHRDSRRSRTIVITILGE